MASEIELVKVLSDKALLCRTKNEYLLNTYLIGLAFLRHEGVEYFCSSWIDYDGYYYMRMIAE